MRIKTKIVFPALCCVVALCGSVHCQEFSEKGLLLFGYFQNEFQQQDIDIHNEPSHSFVTQQLNLFLQKELKSNWTALINFELINNYSSTQQWGSFELEEAWIRYRHNHYCNLKLGLHTPIFNHLNELKNRTPLIPYIIRPLAYESSFGEFISVEEFTPSRAFVQVSGYCPIDRIKVDYSGFIGNGPNTNNVAESVQTGIDTTGTVLFGGRVGIRWKDMKFGGSLTHDRITHFKYFIPPIYGLTDSQLPDEVARIRYGFDGAMYFKKITFESEFIHVNYDDHDKSLNFDKDFLYGTLGYQLNESLFVYSSYCYLEENITDVKGIIRITSLGCAKSINDRAVFKLQWGGVEIEQLQADLSHITRDGNFYNAAISVFF